MALPNVTNSCYLNAATHLLADAGIVGAVRTADPRKRAVAEQYLEVLEQLQNVRRTVAGTALSGTSIAIDALQRGHRTAKMQSFVALCGRTLGARDSPLEVFAALHDLFVIRGAASVQVAACQCADCQVEAKPPATAPDAVYSIVGTYRYKTGDGRPYLDTVGPRDVIPAGLQQTPSLDLEELLFRLAECPVHPADNHLTVTALATGNLAFPAWIIQVNRIEGDSLKDRVLVRFPLRLHGAFAADGGMTDMYLRGMILSYPGHYTYLARHDDGIWWEYDDSVARVVSPLCAANEDVLSYVFGREVVNFLYEYRAHDFPAYPLPVPQDNSRDTKMFQLITHQGQTRRTRDRVERAEEYARMTPAQSSWSSLFFF